MLDFTSALYLGFEHPSWSLPVWSQLSLGKPAALEDLPWVPELESGLAALVGCQRVLLGPSTFHLFWDLLRWQTGFGTTIFVASGSYPIAQWAVDRARAAGAPVRTVGAGQWPRCDWRVSRPVLVTDGFFPASGRAAPLKEYARFVSEREGLLVIDDTQGLGIFGTNAGRRTPFGSGGGGSLRAADLGCERLCVVSSLAKAFGVPVAMIGGAQNLMNDFEAASATRVHCSPPSAPVVLAALNALEMNRRSGDRERRRLAQRVRSFQAGLVGLGLETNGTAFPVQPILLPPEIEAKSLHRELLSRGVRAVLHRAGNGSGEAAISFVLTARHREEDIDGAMASLADALKRVPRSKYKGDMCYGKHAKTAFRPSG